MRSRTLKLLLMKEHYGTSIKKLKSIIPFSFIILVFLQHGLTFAQPQINLNKAYGGTATEYAGQITSTSDGGLIITGTIDNAGGDVSVTLGGMDVWLVKTDVNGNIDWEKSYGGSSYEGPSAITQTANGDYIFTAYSTSQNGDLPATNSNNNLWVMRIDSAGNSVWSEVFGGSSTVDRAVTVHELPDGNIIIGGFTASSDGDITGPVNGDDECWILKLDNQGNLIWSKTYGSSFSETMKKLVPAPDGGFYFLAYSESLNPFSQDGDVTGHHGGYGDFWLAKTDSAGNLLWNKCIGGSGFDNPSDMILSSNNELILMGNTASSDGDIVFTGSSDTGRVWVVRTDLNGNLINERRFGLTALSPQKIIENSPGKFTGIANAMDNNSPEITDHYGPANKSDTWVFTLDTALNITWERCFGGDDKEYSKGLAFVNDSTYAVLSETASNNTGEVSGSGYHHGTTTISPPNSPPITNNNSDLWVFTITEPTITPPSSITEDQLSTFDFFPNPSSGWISVELPDPGAGRVYITDPGGRIVLSRSIDNQKVLLNTSGLGNGFYLITVVQKGIPQTKKFMVLR